MKIYRTETLEFHPDPGQTIKEIQAIISKTQNLIYVKHDWIEKDKVFVLVVKREVEIFPDTIK